MRKKKSRVIAAMLALVLGGVGAHKFYLNRIGAGALYLFLAFFITASIKFPFTIIMGLMDSVKLFSMSDVAFDDLYNSTQSNQNQNNRSNRNINKENRRSSRELDKMEADRRSNSYNKSLATNPFIKSAEKKYKEYDFEGAEKDYNQALKLTRGSKELYFKMACIQSLLENKEKAFAYIADSVRLGFKDFQKIKTIDDLAYLRIQPEFEAFVQRGYTIDKAAKIEAPKQNLLKDDALLSQLNKLKDLRERGLLSDNEYLYEKEKLNKR
ncbi:TM2 domain-containing protein [Saprospiraceae bacterium]|nr:TM2 domain-containing protein [Saprospiraceae bacterium]